MLSGLHMGLAKDNADADGLVAQSEAALAHLSEFPYRAADLHFLAGSSYYRQGRQKSARRQGNLAHAAQHLEKAHALGVADPDRAPLQYRLGYALLQQGKDTSRALELMMLSVEKAAEQPLEGYQLLVDSYMKLQPKPNLDGALRANQRILDLTPPRDVDALGAARLQQAEVLLLKEQRRGDQIAGADRRQGAAADPPQGQAPASPLP